MTTTIIIAAVAAGVIAATMYHPPKNPNVVELKTAADRGANAHWVYSQGMWHHPSDDLPKGKRAGAQSYPFAKEAGAHFEIPYTSSAGYYNGENTLWAYERQRLDNGGFSNNHGVPVSYNGEGYLPPGSWTGAPLADFHGSDTQMLTWRHDAQGRIRPDEIAGRTVNLDTMMAKPVAPAPAPAK